MAGSGCLPFSPLRSSVGGSACSPVEQGSYQCFSLPSVWAGAHSNAGSSSSNGIVFYFSDPVSASWFSSPGLLLLLLVMQVSLATLRVLLSLRVFSILRCSLIVFLFPAVQRRAV